MQRTIKFRAIDKKTKTVVFEGTLSDVRNAAGRLNFTTWEWLQYFGLKDKNGKEICEGDILKYANGRLSDPIEFPKDYTWLKARTENPHWRSDVEVIGNVFENPELLQTVDE